MPVPFPEFEYIDEAQSQSPDLETTEKEEFGHEKTSYFHNEPRIFIDSLGHTYSDMKSNQEPYSTYAKVITIPHKKVQEPVTFTSRHTITLTSMATLTSFTTIFETKHLRPVDPLPKVTSKITTHITITAVKDHSTSSAWTSRPTKDLNPSSPSSVDESTGPSLWSTVTISDKIPSSSILTTSYTARHEPNLPTATEASSPNDSLTKAEIVGVAVGVCFILSTICFSTYLYFRHRRNRKGTRACSCLPHDVSRFPETPRSNPTPSNWPYGQELKTILASLRSTKVNRLLTTDARPSSLRHPDGYNTDLDQDPGSKGKGRAE
ncbi:hypothetical protein DER46DRAFT_572945 [Fusarium sp. MPI-SDFR-AT-0072]|nr:hypothetical protein DER46DRAFT_572945 [Fusarium sp. MPI-SDFR-AT-0072]